VEPREPVLASIIAEFLRRGWNFAYRTMAGVRGGRMRGVLVLAPVRDVAAYYDPRGPLFTPGYFCGGLCERMFGAPCRHCAPPPSAAELERMRELLSAALPDSLQGVLAACCAGDDAFAAALFLGHAVSMADANALSPAPGGQAAFRTGARSAHPPPPPLSPRAANATLALVVWFSPFVWRASAEYKEAAMGLPVGCTRAAANLPTTALGGASCNGAAMQPITWRQEVIGNAYCGALSRFFARVATRVFVPAAHKPFVRFDAPPAGSSWSGCSGVFSVHTVAGGALCQARARARSPAASSPPS